MAARMRTVVDDFQVAAEGAAFHQLAVVSDEVKTPEDNPQPLRRLRPRMHDSHAPDGIVGDDSEGGCLGIEIPVDARCREIGVKRSMAQRRPVGGGKEKVTEVNEIYHWSRACLGTGMGRPLAISTKHPVCSAVAMSWPLTRNSACKVYRARPSAAIHM